MLIYYVKCIITNGKYNLCIQSTMIIMPVTTTLVVGAEPSSITNRFLIKHADSITIGFILGYTYANEK